MGAWAALLIVVSTSRDGGELHRQIRLCFRGELNAAALS